MKECDILVGVKTYPPTYFQGVNACGGPLHFNYNAPFSPAMELQRLDLVWLLLANISNIHLGQICPTANNNIKISQLWQCWRLFS